jgi:hypothetical protein
MEGKMFGKGPISRGMMHHPYIIKDMDELPIPLMQLAYNHMHLFDSFDFMIVIPDQTFLKGLFGRRFVPQQALLFYPEGILHLQDTKPQEKAGKVTWIEAEHLRWLCSSLLLLYGKLEITAEKGQEVQKIEVEYNTVAHDLMKPYIQRFLKCSWSSDLERLNDQLRFDQASISHLPYKFQSGLRIYAVQPQEEICGLVFQPEILQPRLGFFRRKITPNTLIALTDRQIVLIQEEIASTSNYGWVITHWPRQHIKDIHTEPLNEWQILQIQAGLSAEVEAKNITLAPDISKNWMQIAAAIQ